LKIGVGGVEGVKFSSPRGEQLPVGFCLENSDRTSYLSKR